MCLLLSALISASASERTWVGMGPLEPMQDVLWTPSGLLVAISEDGEIWLSRDEGQSWSQTAILNQIGSELDGPEDVSSVLSDVLLEAVGDQDAYVDPAVLEQIASVQARLQSQEIADQEQPEEWDLSIADRKIWVTGPTGVFSSSDGIEFIQVIEKPHEEQSVPGAFPVRATPDGLFKETTLSFTGPVDEWVPLEVILTGTLRRPELQQRLRDQRVVAALLPQLTINGRLRVSDGVHFSGSDPAFIIRNGGTVREVRGMWRVGMELRWTPPGHARSVLGGAYGDTSGIDVGGVLEASGTTIQSVESSYSRDLISRIRTLYERRMRAASRRSASKDLLSQVLLELHIDQLEADLDVFSDGAIAAWTLNGSKGKRMP